MIVKLYAVVLALEVLHQTGANISEISQKPSIRVCCPRNRILANSECSESVKKELLMVKPYLNKFLDDGSMKTLYLNTDLKVESDRFEYCDEFYKLTGDELIMFENGDFSIQNQNLTISKEDFCLYANQHNLELRKDLFLVIHRPCEYRSSEEPNQEIYIVVISLTCSILTIAVYVFVTKKWNLIQMCFFCYIICFSFHHGMWILTKYGNLLNEACTLAGYARYFFALGSLFWLFAISFQIRIGLLAIHVNDSRYRFGIYNVFVWGLAALGTSAIFLIDRIWGGDLSTLKWMPSIGFYQCWFHPNDWSILIYFIGPILALNCINWIFFLVAVFQIKKVALNLKKYQTSNSIPQKRRYLKFLRLFVMMGMSWILDFIPYFIRGNVYWQYLFLPVFYYHLSLGSVVFVLFALKSSTRRLVMERIQGRTQSPLVQI